MYHPYVPFYWQGQHRWVKLFQNLCLMIMNVCFDWLIDLYFDWFCSLENDLRVRRFLKCVFAYDTLWSTVMWPCESHSEHRFPAPSSKLRASLSGTFLQSPPDLVTPLKGHSLSPRSCPPTRSAPPERSGYWYDCRSNLAPKHPHKHETHPPRVKKKKKEERVPSRKRFWFYLSWRKQHGHLQNKRLI